MSRTDVVGAATMALEGALGEHAPPYLEVYDHHGPFLFPKWTIPPITATHTMAFEVNLAQADIP